MDQSAKADTLRQLHFKPPILVLPNAWDVASAKALAALPGCRALATTSAAVARSLGWEDGEQAPALVGRAGKVGVKAGHVTLFPSAARGPGQDQAQQRCALCACRRAEPRTPAPSSMNSGRPGSVTTRRKAPSI